MELIFKLTVGISIFIILGISLYGVFCLCDKIESYIKRIVTNHNKMKPISGGGE